MTLIIRITFKVCCKIWGRWAGLGKPAQVWQDRVGVSKAAVLAWCYYTMMP